MFTGLIGCDPASLATPGGYNPSLGAEQAELLRRVNLALGDRLTDLRVKGGYRDVVRGTLAKGVLSHQQGAALLLPAELAGWCREQSLARVAEIEARGYDVVGRLEDLVPADAGPEAGRGAPEVTDAQVVEAAAQALASLADHQHRELTRQKQERKRSRGAAVAAAGAPARPLLTRVRSRAGLLARRARNR